MVFLLLLISDFDVDVYVCLRQLNSPASAQATQHLSQGSLRTLPVGHYRCQRLSKRRASGSAAHLHALLQVVTCHPVDNRCFPEDGRTTRAALHDPGVIKVTIVGTYQDKIQSRSRDITLREPQALLGLDFLQRKDIVH
jgi:hypothetical protein